MSYQINFLLSFNNFERSLYDFSKLPTRFDRLAVDDIDSLVSLDAFIDCHHEAVPRTEHDAHTELFDIFKRSKSQWAASMMTNRVYCCDYTTVAKEGNIALIKAHMEASTLW